MTLKRVSMVSGMSSFLGAVICIFCIKGVGCLQECLESLAVCDYLVQTNRNNFTIGVTKVTY